MSKAKTVLYPDSNGNLPDYSNESCFQKLYSKLLIKMIGKRTVITNANLSWTYGESGIASVNSGIFFNVAFANNLKITQRLTSDNLPNSDGKFK